jgi:hypothetical protein
MPQIHDFTSLPKEGVLRIFPPLKIRRLRPRLNPRTWVPEASTLTPRPPKPLRFMLLIGLVMASVFKPKHVAILIQRTVNQLKLQLAAIKFWSCRNQEQTELRDCLLHFGPESFVFPFCIQICELQHTEL